MNTFHVISQCRKYNVSLWACPPFLFILMGGVNVAGMVTTAIAAQRFSDDPAVVIISVSMMAAFLFVVGNAVVSSFQRLADASRIKSEFVNIVSHQLRSPLSAIKWQLELMLDQMKTVTGDAAVTMGIIRRQNERMIALVNDLLEVNRIEDDRVILRPTAITIDNFVEQIANGYKPLAEQANEKLVFVGEARPLVVFADETKLRWVTENLIDNAIRYTKAGGEVTVKVLRAKNMARIEITDSGIGIPVADQAMIFQKFFRSENALRLRAEGTGLGLYLVRSLVGAMGGKAGFASMEGKGSTFWYALPLVSGEAMVQKK
ncbi:MAG: HAMP domain-containing histidine kinase [Candidatus Ryanbacteria bacterium]|nr:HAMP domain-containing histidine kinase [Candidatus Ryanbacteria bacterium]